MLLVSPPLSTVSINKQQRADLRTHMRQQRRQLSPEQQLQAATQLAHSISEQDAFKAAHHLAFYMPVDGEISPLPLIELALQQQKHCYLPVLEPDSKTLIFTRFDSDEGLITNFYGLREPPVREDNTIAASALDLVLLPLVAFDEYGTRLGMGGGYYDRTFAFMQDPQTRQQPLLMGLAHECQRVEKLGLAEWDIPLHEIMTDRHRYRAASR